MRAVVAALLLCGSSAFAQGQGTIKFDPAAKKEMIAAREKAAQARRTHAIKMLEELLAMKPGEATASDAIYKLAELYWEDSRQKLAADMAVWEKAEKKGAPPPKLDVTRSEKLYRELVEKYPRFRRMDVALYLLGFGAHEAGRREEAGMWLGRLIAEKPESTLVPDAWMMLGEGRFSQTNFAGAREAYAKVLEHKDSPVYDLALFKTAWCDWKLGDTRLAAERFKEVLDLASAAEKSGSAEQKRRSIQLRDEALQYLTLLFTEDETVTAKDAYDFLSSIGGERYSREVLGRLADLFYSQGRYDRAVQAWRHLVTLDPAHLDAPRHQLRVVEALLAMEFADDAVAAAKELATGYGPGSPWAKPTSPSVAAAMLPRKTHRRTRIPFGPGYCPASVATSFQLGSRDDRSRAKVHTSVTSVTFSALPSITAPALSRVTEISCDTKRTVICAVRARSSAPVISDLSIDTNRVSTVSPLPSRSRIAASKPS